jgi:hypothetical protein
MEFILCSTWNGKTISHNAVQWPRRAADQHCSDHAGWHATFASTIGHLIFWPTPTLRWYLRWFWHLVLCQDLMRPLCRQRSR